MARLKRNHNISNPDPSFATITSTSRNVDKLSFLTYAASPGICRYEELAAVFRRL